MCTRMCECVCACLSSEVPQPDDVCVHVCVNVCVLVCLVKYLGLMAMSKILKTHPKSVQAHKDLILQCLDDKDESIRLRALDLLYGMVRRICCDLKSKGFPYLLTCAGPGADLSVQIVSLQVTISHPPGGRLPLLLLGLWLPSQPQSINPLGW